MDRFRQGTARESNKARSDQDKHGELAQMGEHLPCTQGVKGSNPLFSTRYVSKTQKSIYVMRLQSPKAYMYLEN